MVSERSLRCVRTALFLSLVLGLVPPLRAEVYDPVVDSLRREASELERQGKWAEAAERYGQFLARERNAPAVRQRYLFCLRRDQQVRRFHDETYRRQAASLSLTDALQLYADVLTRLEGNYVDRKRADAGLLFRQGLEEVGLALEDDFFRRQWLFDVPVDRIREFATQLRSASAETIAGDQVPTRARELALAAQSAIRLAPSLFVLELTCGACSGLDEYTAFLTPGQMSDLNASWKGEAVGVGIELAGDEQQLVVAQVLADSPALEQGVKAGDRVLRIGDRGAMGLTADGARQLLGGEKGSTVEIELLGMFDMRARVVKLQRRPLVIPSVSEPRFADPQSGIGYLQLTGFQETTVRELNAAVARLQAMGMRVLILDLRGNPGGLFYVARQVVERFISSGVIVSTHGQVREYNCVYEAHGADVLSVPLVVLVDGETASSAEMVAGALKDRQRGTLVGQTTFGKGSIQKVREVGKAGCGLRMTVAKFYSPSGKGLSGAGVPPHIAISRPDMPMEFDTQLQAALDVARPLAGR